MSSKICLTGIKPTGMPHLGNYMGAIKPAIDTANKGEFKGYYFIADYHSLITIHDGNQLRSDIREVAAAWLASGLDPSVMLLIWASFVIMFLGIVDLSNLSGRWVLRFSLNSVVTVPR